MRSTSLSIVIPVYNSETILPTLIDRIGRVLPSVDSNAEAILVNDGSNDQSWEIICELSRRYEWVHGIDLMRNYGQHNALLCGIRAAKGEIVITMDDDLEHPPEEIPKLIGKLEEGYDVVYGRPQKRQRGFLRHLATQVTKLALQNTMGAEIAQTVSAFRAFRTRLRDAFANYRSPFVSIDVLLTWGTTRFVAIPVRHDSRWGGESHYTPRKLASHALNMMTGFSTWPLQLASLVGFGFTLFGLGVLAYVLGRFLIHGRVVPGFAFLASVIAIFSGAQFFALGIIGEYLARMHFRTMEKPPYIIHATFDGGANNAPRRGGNDG